MSAFIASDPENDRFKPILQRPPATTEDLPTSLRDKFVGWLAKQPKN